jgi:hypothetical protein
MKYGSADATVAAVCERLSAARYGSHRQPLQVKVGDFFDVGVAQSGLLGEARPVDNGIARFFKNFFGVVEFRAFSEG